MDNFTPLKKSKEKKKINKLLIFGNLFLAIFVAFVGIIYYNGTLITTQQQAKNAKDIQASKEKQKAEDEKAAAKEEKKAAAQAEKKAAKTIESNNGSNCSDGQTFCSVTLSNGKSQGLCISDSASGCNAAAVDAGYSVQTGGGGSGSGGWVCVVGKNGYTGGQCVEYNSVKSIGAGKPPSCFCGIIQIDGGEYNGTYQSNCGCNQEEQTAMQSTALVGTIIPTPTGEESLTPTEIPTSTPTPTIVPTLPEELTPTDTLYEITPTITPTPTITQLICATKDCNETTRPCQPGNTCIKANNGSNYCSNTSLIDACKSNPTDSACCKIVPTSNATPTEIIVAKVSVSPTAVAKLLKTGTASFIYLIPSALLLIGLLF